MHSCIFEGRVRHTRLRPVRHRFDYRLFLMYLDLDELPRVFRGRWFWSDRRVALARFRREHHLGDPSTDLATAVRDLVGKETGQRPPGPVRLLTHLSYFGYCFNPVSFYYCYEADGETLHTVVAEVNNTPWGERHCYVLPAARARRHGKALRFQPDKEMHVSPFMPMDVDYDWVFRQPGKELRVFMAIAREGTRLFDAALLLQRKEISSASLARVLLVYPFMTLRVIVGIHWQALKLWLKRCPLYIHPEKRIKTVSTR